MRWSLVAVRIGMVAVSLFITAVILLSVMPMASGDLKVNVPERDDSEGLEHTYEDGVITVSIPLDIYNGGYFAIENLRIHLEVREGGVLISETSSPPTDVVPGKESRIVLAMSVDLDDFSDDDKRRIVFEGAGLDMEVLVEAGYALGLASASIRTTQGMEWDPLISDVSVRSGETRFRPNETNSEEIEVLVPYSFRVSDVIQGEIIDIHAVLGNASAELAHIDRSIELVEYNNGDLSFVIPEDAARELEANPGQELRLDVYITFAGATMHGDYPVYWGGMA